MIKRQLIKYILSLSLFCLIAGCLFLSPSYGQETGLHTTLTWSTNSYVPANYPGKRLPVPGSLIEVIADLETRASTIRKLDFQWFLNDQLQRQASGNGQRNFQFIAPNSPGSKLEVKLEAREQGLRVASKELTIKIVRPQVVIYAANNSFLARNKYQLANHQQVKFSAVPYFFNIQNLNNLDFYWTLDDQAANESDRQPDLLNLGVEIAGLTEAITQKLELLVKNKEQANQQAQTQTAITIIP